MKTYYVKCSKDLGWPGTIEAHNKTFAASLYHQSQGSKDNAIVLVWSAKQWENEENPSEFRVYRSS